jgi:hypothetical protein
MVRWRCLEELLHNRLPLRRSAVDAAQLWLLGFTMVCCNFFTAELSSFIVLRSSLLGEVNVKVESLSWFHLYLSKISSACPNP